MTESAPAPGLILGAPASGQGKTIATLAIVRALVGRGLRVAVAKVGPDYIDPAFHAAAGADPCFNLDVWAMRPATVSGLAGRLAADADIVVAEGVMGLFDGAADGTGSTADLATATGWPVVLVVDVRGQGASVAALLRGFAIHRPDAPLAGVILNRVGGPAHRESLGSSIAAALPDLPVLGCLPRDESLALPARHLGLVQAGEHPELEAFLDRAGRMAADAIDLDALRSIARPGPAGSNLPVSLPPPGQRIGVARDEAFAFSYLSVIEGWRAAGAEVSFFSPLADEAPDSNTDAVYLPGGYPELHAGRLAASSTFLDGLRGAAKRGAWLFGECGGYMVLGRGLVDADGARHAMAGLLPLETTFAERRLHLGYRRLVLQCDSPFGVSGTYLKGHEFHYATIVDEGPGTPLFSMADARGEDRGVAGRANGRVMGSFIHLIDLAG